MAKDIFIRKNKLSLVLTTGLMTSLPVLSVAANPGISGQGISGDSPWQCVASGTGWRCGAASAEAPVVKKVAVSKAMVAQAVAPAARVVSETSTRAAQQLSESSAKAINTLDWRAIGELSPARQQLRKSQLCLGGYAEPHRPGIDYVGDPSQAPIFIDADESSYDEVGIGIATGNVVLRQGYRQIESSKAQLDRKTNTATFTDNVVIREPNLLMVGTSAKVNTDTGQAEVNDAQYVFHAQGTRGEAKTIVRAEDGTVMLTDASYTSCPPGGCAWSLNGSTVELDQESGFGTATHATVDVLGLPIFYTPWMTFPINDKRKSGLLFPAIGYEGGSDGNGFQYTQPIYWNIAPNMDATITPRILTNRAGVLESEFRYLDESSMTVLGGAYTTPDKVREENLNYDKNRWFVHLDRKQQLTGNWNYQIDYTRASDKAYFEDYGTNLSISSLTPLSQNIYTNVTSTGDNPLYWRASLGTQHWQNMDEDGDDPYNKNIDFNLAGGWDEGVGLGVSYQLAYTDFQRDHDWQFKKMRVVDEEYDVLEGEFGPGAATDIKNATGGRLYAETGAHYRFENSYSYLEPGVKVRSVHYRLDNLEQAYVDQYASGSRSDAETPGTTAPTAYLDGGMFFDRKVNFGDMAFTQTLEPRFRYVYTPYRGGQSLNPVFDTGEASFTYNSLWADDRFNGYDRIGDTNHLSLGLTSRFLQENGVERFRFSIGQIIYFEDREVLIDPNLDKVLVDGVDQSDTNLGEEQQRLVDDNRAKQSPIATQLVWNIQDNLRLTQDWIYNVNQDWNQDYALGLQYKPVAGSVFNARYRYKNRVDRALKNRFDGNNVIDPVTGKPVYVNGDLEEVTLSAVWPLSTQWSVYGRYTRDLTNKRNTDRAIGFEQDSCCYNIRIMYRNWINPEDDIDLADADKGIFLEFVLKGLGNISGSRVTEFLQDVSGYRRR